MLAFPPPFVLLSWVTQCLLHPSTEASTGLTQRLAQGCVESTASLPSPNGSLYSGISGQNLWENTVTSTGLESPGKTVRHPRPSSPFLQHWGEQTVLWRIYYENEPNPRAKTLFFLLISSNLLPCSLCFQICQLIQLYLIHKKQWISPYLINQVESESSGSLGWTESESWFCHVQTRYPSFCHSTTQDCCFLSKWEEQQVLASTAVAKIKWIQWLILLKN